MSITPQEALQRTIEHREIFYDEMLSLMRQIMAGEISPVMTAAILTGPVSYTHLDVYKRQSSRRRRPTGHRSAAGVGVLRARRTKRRWPGKRQRARWNRGL